MTRFLVAALGALALSTAAVTAEEAKPAAAAAGTYPLKTCVVSGEELGSMGKPVVIQHEGKEVQFCCKSCMPKFKKDPAKYMKKLETAKQS